MEDSAVVRHDLGDRNRGAVLVVVADGHGSIPAYGDGSSSGTSRYIGGVECVLWRVQCIADHVARVGRDVAFDSLDRARVAAILHEAFDSAQKAFGTESRKGARRSDARDKDRTGRSEERTRQRDLASGRIDGYHFRDLAEAKRVALNTGGTAEWEGRRRRWLVADKVLVPAPIGGEVVAYMPGDRKCFSVLGRGVRHDGDRGAFPAGTSEVYVAHAGDSDAYASARAVAAAGFAFLCA